MTAHAFVSAPPLSKPATKLALRVAQLLRENNGRTGRFEVVEVGGRWIVLFEDGRGVEDLGPVANGRQ